VTSWFARSGSGFRVSNSDGPPMSSPIIPPLAWKVIPALTVGLCLGCGGAKEPEMAGPPPGMELAKPVPPPKPSPEDLSGSSADPGNQAPK
jgi:hypothetical protein